MELVLQPTPPAHDASAWDNFAVVLCGGGAAGRWQAGVLTALAQAGVLEHAKLITGTSVGGLNAGLFALYGSRQPETMGDHDPNVLPIDPYVTAVDVWESIRRNEDVYRGSINWFTAALGFLTGAESILDPAPLYDKLNYIFGDQTLGDVYSLLKTDIVVTVANMNTKRAEFLSSFDPKTKDILIKDALVATSAIPGVFKTKCLKYGDMSAGSWYCDGGMIANNPFVILDRYNAQFPEKKITKILVIYCYPEELVDIGTTFAGSDNKSYKAFRDALLGAVPTMLNGQEQMTELSIIDKVRTQGWNVMAMWPKTQNCGPLDFYRMDQLKAGYDYGVIGMGESYKDVSAIHILDFLNKKYSPV